VRFDNRAGIEQSCPIGLGLDVGLIISTTQPKARRDSVARVQLLRGAQLTVAEDRPKFGIDSQEVVRVRAIGFRCVVDDLDRREGSNPESAPPSPGGM
jgi:hypothetical protein